MSAFNYGGARPAALGDQVYLVHGRDVSIMTTFEAAIGWAWTISWSDDNWFDALEIVERGGTSKRYENDDPQMRKWLSAEDGRRMADLKAHPGPAHSANLVLDDEVVNSYFGPAGPERAVADADLLRPFLGDRLKVEVVEAP